jgi:hypothetical protein
MRTLSRAAGEVLDAVSQDLEVGAGRKIDNSGGTYMAVHVDRLGPSTVSLAHYYEQNGDLVCDPDGVFVRTDAGWLPVALQLCTGHCVRAIELGEDDRPVGVRPRALRELIEFTSMWLRNISDQQGGPSRIRESITDNKGG